ncbi:MAG: hypothetical protein AB1749_02395 [Pseudomonadota bacterium]
MRFIARSAMWLALVGMLAPSAVVAASRGMLAVEVTNRSEPVLCAEKDNVTLTLASPAVRAFHVEAAHPAYLPTVAADSFEPDWTACEFKGEAVAAGPPERMTIYEDIELWVVAHKGQSFWREARTKVRIGDKVYAGLHLLQVWVIRPMGGEEVLVLYPQDGYWRLRPKSPPGRAPTAFGSSFLIGPVAEDKGRPVVDLAEVAFDPKTRTFTLAFAAGGSARVVLAELDAERHRLEVTLDKPIAGTPFAALRSMFVTRFNNDAAEVGVLEQGAAGWREEPVMQFKGAKAATDVWLGRTALSRHNTSAPDMVLGGFSDGSRPARDAGSPAKR